MPADHPFSKDFGYLGKFLQGITAYAAGLEEGDFKQKLLSLLEGEPERWAQIGSLLSEGAPAKGGEEVAPPPTAAPAKTQPSTAAEVAPTPPTSWTVGSLFGASQ